MIAIAIALYDIAIIIIALLAWVISVAVAYICITVDNSNASVNEKVRPKAGPHEYARDDGDADRGDSR